MLEVGAGRSYVALTYQHIGDDLSVTITGGNRPHIGAVAFAYSVGNTISVQTLSAPNHKEAELAANAAKEICQATGHAVLVSCGIHIDHASSEEIDILCCHTKSLQTQLLSKLSPAI